MLNQKINTALALCFVWIFALGLALYSYQLLSTKQLKLILDISIPIWKAPLCR